MKYITITLALAFIVSVRLAQTTFKKHPVKKPHVYKIDYADTVNIYNDKIVIVVKDLKGGLKYIVLRKQDKYLIKNANVVNMYQ